MDVETWRIGVGVWGSIEYCEICVGLLEDDDGDSEGDEGGEEGRFIYAVRTSVSKAIIRSVSAA